MRMRLKREEYLRNERAMAARKLRRAELEAAAESGRAANSQLGVLLSELREAQRGGEGLRSVEVLDRLATEMKARLARADRARREKATALGRLEEAGGSLAWAAPMQRVASDAHRAITQATQRLEVLACEVAAVERSGEARARWPHRAQTELEEILGEFGGAVEKLEAAQEEFLEGALGGLGHLALPAEDEES
jgi:hypothetical protein